MPKGFPLPRKPFHLYSAAEVACRQDRLRVIWAKAILAHCARRQAQQPSSFNLIASPGSAFPVERSKDILILEGLTDMTDIDRSTQAILQIVDITNILEEQPNLEEGLREVAALTAQMLKTRRCSIMLLAETDAPEPQEACLKVFTHYGNLPLSAYAEVTPLNQGIAGRVAATGTPLLIEDITKSEFAPAARYPDAENKSLMSAPIFSGEQAIGTINVSSPIEKACFDGGDLEVLQLFALFVGKSIHTAQLQTIVRSKFVQMAVISDFAERQVPASVALHPNPTKLAKIVAKSFFRELTQAGFSANQIIEIATEVLNLLQDSLGKYKQRLARDES